MGTWFVNLIPPQAPVGRLPWCSLGAASVLQLTACSPEQQKVSAATAAEAIWKEYSESLNAGDLDRWLDLWTDDGIQMPPDEAPISGIDSIRARYEADRQPDGSWKIHRDIFNSNTPPRGR